MDAIRLRTLRSRLAGMAVYVYRAGPWLVDAGFSNARRQLLDWSGLDEATACILTHHHEDHVGNAAALSERGLEIVAPPRVVEGLAEAAGERIPPYRRFVWGIPRVGEVIAVPGAFQGAGWTLRPVHTLGHARDHHVLHEPERDVVFSADLYIARRVPVAKLDENPYELLRSLRRVRDLRPRVMFCAHRGRLENPVEALTGKIDWIEGVVDRARQLHDRGVDVKEISRRILGAPGLICWVSGGELTKRNFVRVILESDPSGANVPDPT